MLVELGGGFAEIGSRGSFSAVDSGPEFGTVEIELENSALFEFCFEFAGQ